LFPRICITYRDIFGHAHVTQICGLYDPTPTAKAVAALANCSWSD